MKEKINVKIKGTFFLFFLFLLIFSFQIPMKVFAEKSTKNELADAIANETSARQEADATLQSNIDEETIAREAGDQASQAAIDAEALARGAEDTTLQGAIDTEIAQRKDVIEGIIADLRFVNPATPPTIGFVDCIIGIGMVCATLDGELIYFCPQGNQQCFDEVPDPNYCPDACEDLGGVVVIDHRSITCPSGGAAPEIDFVCMSPEVYANRPSCPEGTVLNYNSDKGGWWCELLAPDVVHVATDLFDLIETISLFERARTDLTDEDLQNQIDNINLCECPGVFAPVCGSDNNTYVNSCEAKCANQTVAHSGVCIGD